MKFFVSYLIIFISSGKCEKDEKISQLTSDTLNVFFSNYTEFLSQSIELIADSDLRNDVETQFREVMPSLWETVNATEDPKRPDKLRKMLTELRGIETLLMMVVKKGSMKYTQMMPRSKEIKGSIDQWSGN